MKIFSGRTAFVTGGASGIGYGMVHSFLREGMKPELMPSHTTSLLHISQGQVGPARRG